MAVLEQLLVPFGHHEAHGLLFKAFLVGAVETDHAVHQGAVVAARRAVDVLLETRERAERLDVAVFEVILALGDIARVVRHGVGDVVAGHRGDAEDGDGARTLEVDRLLIARGKAAVEVAGVAAVGRHLLHRDRHFLLRVGEVGHVGEQH